MPRICKNRHHRSITNANIDLSLQSWTFRHPDFQADRREALENIKRKVPAARKSLLGARSAAAGGGGGPGAG